MPILTETDRTGDLFADRARPDAVTDNRNAASDEQDLLSLAEGRERAVEVGEHSNGGDDYWPHVDLDEELREQDYGQKRLVSDSLHDGEGGDRLACLALQGSD